MMHKSESNWVHKEGLPAHHYRAKCGEVIHYENMTFSWRGVTCQDCKKYETRRPQGRNNSMSENKQKIIDAINEFSHLKNDLEKLATSLELKGLKIGKNTKINKDSLYAFMYRNDLLPKDTNSDIKKKALIEMIKKLKALRYTQDQMVLELNRMNMKTEKMAIMTRKALYNFIYRNNL